MAYDKRGKIPPKKTAPANKKRVPSSAKRQAARLPEKTVVSRPKKRKRVRGGNYTLYYILAVIIVVIVLIVLSNTVLFRCSGFDVSGNDIYSSEEIIAASGVQTGENLFHISKPLARENIINSLAYIDDAEVSKSFPTTIKITVSEAEKQFCVVNSGFTVVISRRGKIIEKGAPAELPVVIGYEPETIAVGEWLSSKTEGKSDIPETIFTAAEKTGLADITEIDMTDKFSVKVKVRDRVILNLGPVENIESKFRVAVEIIENQLGKDEYVTLLLTNPEKVPVQNNPAPAQSSSSSASSSTSTSTALAPEEPQDPAVEEPQPEEPPAEDPQPEEPPAEAPQPEEPPAEDPPLEEPPAEDPPPEDPAAEDPPLEDPTAEEPQPEDPT